MSAVSGRPNRYQNSMFQMQSSPVWLSKKDPSTVDWVRQPIMHLGSFRSPEIVDCNPRALGASAKSCSLDELEEKCSRAFALKSHHVLR